MVTHNIWKSLLPSMILVLHQPWLQNGPFHLPQHMNWTPDGLMALQVQVHHQLHALPLHVTHTPKSFLDDVFCYDLILVQCLPSLEEKPYLLEEEDTYKLQDDPESGEKLLGFSPSHQTTLELEPAVVDLDLDDFSEQGSSFSCRFDCASFWTMQLMLFMQGL